MKRPLDTRSDLLPIEEYLAFRGVWERCSAQLRHARLLAGDVPNAPRPPYSVSQLESWAHRQLNQLSAAASNCLHGPNCELAADTDLATHAAPMADALLRFSMETLQNLRSHVHGRAMEGVERLSARLSALPSEAIVRSPQWLSLPQELRSLLASRHGPAFLSQRLLELPPTDEVESHLAAIRSLRSVLDKLDLWDALTLPLCTRVHRSEETRLVPAPMGRHEGTDDGMPERHVVPRSSFSVTAHVCGRAVRHECTVLPDAARRPVCIGVHRRVRMCGTCTAWRHLDTGLFSSS